MLIRRLAMALLLLIGGLAAVCHYYPIFVLHRIVVAGALPDQRDKYAALLGAQPGANLLSLDLAAWSQRILSDRAVSSVRVRTSLSGTVRADMELEHPVFLLDTHPVCGLSDEGVMLPLLYHTPETRVSLLSGVGGTPNYYQIAWSPRIRTAIAFARVWDAELGADSLQLSEIHVTPDGEVEAYLWPNRLLIRMGRGNWHQPLTNLKPILSHLAASERSLDMRFEGQVVETVQGET